MRLAKIEIKDFRAFPGPGTYAFDLGGKNLLVYSENSSGKSSLFRALVEFFNLDCRAKPALHKKPCFSTSFCASGVSAQKVGSIPKIMVRGNYNLVL